MPDTDDMPWDEGEAPEAGDGPFSDEGLPVRELDAPPPHWASQGEGAPAPLPASLAPSAVEVLRTATVPMTQVRMSPHQPRKAYDPLVIEALKASLEAVGMLQRPRVREQGGAYELVFGHQRAEAAKQLGWPELPVEVVACDDLTARRMTLHENLKASKLHPIEHAEALCKFLDATLSLEPGHELFTAEDPVERVHDLIVALAAPNPGEGDPKKAFARRHEAHIRQVIRELANKEPRAFLLADVNLLRLPDAILQTAVEKGLKKGHVKALGALHDQDPEAFEEVMAHGLGSAETGYQPLERSSVAALRQLVPSGPSEGKRKGIQADPVEPASYRSYVPLGLPGRPEGGGMPWDEGEEDAPWAAPSEGPLGALAEAHRALTQLSAEEWAGLLAEADPSQALEAQRHWADLYRLSQAVLARLGQ